MKSYLLRRLGLSLLTLCLLSVVVFVTAQVLPGDSARRILGPFASPDAVAALNEQLGTDRGLLTQYGDWIGHFARGDMGDSLAFRRPVSEVVMPALWNSAKLALLAFVLVVPLAIIGGLVAAYAEGRLPDRVISLGGLSAAVVPEFVWAVLLILVFSLGLGWFPTTAHAPDGAGPFTQLQYLWLPSMCLVLVLFGYIARMTRAGTIEVIKADYTRTAVLKGLPWRTVLRRHVLRNALLPTIAVVASQVGYLVGGLVAIEVVFNYQGLGQVLFRAAQQKDFPVLQSAVLVIGIVYLVATLIADLLYSLLNPRVRVAGAE